MIKKSHQPLSSVVNTYLARAVSVLLMVLLSLACAQVFWQGYGYWLLPSPATNAFTPLPKSQNTFTSEPKYADSIGSAYLFGRPLVSKTQISVAVAQIPESSLKVTIKGILALADTSRSTVILSVENATDKVFRVGQELKPGYFVEKIVAQGAVLDHNGRLEMVRLPRATLADISASNAASLPSSAAGLGQLRSEVLRNPLAMEQHISFVPYTQNGQFAGYRVNPGKKPQMFVKLGLQADDIVASVDGVGIGQLAGRMDILTNLSIVKNLRLGIIRNGQKQQLLVDFSQ